MLKHHYRSLDGIGLAQLIKKKQISVSEAVEAAISQIEERNPKLNAVIQKFYENNDDITKNCNLDGPFAGVPTLLKDITHEIKGKRITLGSKAYQNYIAKQDAEYVRRLRKSGVVFLGYTNVPEFALMGVTEPQFYGPTRNPWHLDYTPGGSSGGAAAAVASRMVPFAGANDGGGSIRIPAAYCSLFGLKPTRGRVPVGPSSGRNWQGASTDHVLTRSVRDSAALLDQLVGEEKGAAFRAPSFDGSYLEMASKPLEKKLTIAFSVTSPIGTEVDQECKQAVYKTVKYLEGLGHNVEEKNVPVDGEKILNSYLMLYFGEVSATLRELESTLGRKIVKEDVEQLTWLLNLIGKNTSAADMVLSLNEWDRAAFAMEAFHEKYDIYITPTTAMPPAKIGQLQPNFIEHILIKIVGKAGFRSILKNKSMIDKLSKDSLMRTPFTQLANLTGQPAMSLPLHLTKTGLPCGVQCMAARGREDLLVQLASLFEKSEHWVHCE